MIESKVTKNSLYSGASKMKVWPGQPYPFGAVYDGYGTNFSLFSQVAERVELCLFDVEGQETHLDLTEVSGDCWHGYIPTIEPGQRYGFRVHGPWVPAKGLRCNPSKLLLDPYAKAIEGQIQWNEAVFPYDFNNPEVQNKNDSAPFMPRCIVHQPHFDWNGDRRLQHPWHDTIIYEIHVKGFTANHPDIPPELRGTYAGLAHPAAIEYLKKLGITAIELMPVHHFVHDKHLVDRGLKNYWGYHPISYFAPHFEYAFDKRPGAAVAEFKQLVKVLHQAGIEVILDVVYNHTGEGNHFGPMLSFKGIDNTYYYRVVQNDNRYYQDYTGTGNTLNMRHPHVLQLLMDSLRYWVLEMHVDGFRFDLAATLARELHDVDRLSAFFDLIQQDPVISQVKLIAEPWDVGEGGYQVGNFPPVWTEWNGKYRDCVRDFWRGNEQTLGEFASRFTGSSDLYENTSRRPHASINFITAHDGFTLEDLVSYNSKHNEANLEENRDGESNNRSWNCGVEGPTNDAAVIQLRNKQKRNFLTTLFLSQGVPMLLCGDEFGRSQQGNNNPYCQDNEITWINWEHMDDDLFIFCKKLIQYRKDHLAFRRRGWFQGIPIYNTEVKDIAWFNLDGQQMLEQNWSQPFAKSLGVFLNGKTIPNPNLRGEPVFDDDFYIIFNAHDGPLNFTLPGDIWGESWFKELDTHVGWTENAESLKAGSQLQVESRSIVVLRNAS